MDVQELSSSEMYFKETDSNSLKEKALLKKHNNNNFKSGYVAVDTECRKKTGMRGRRTFAFWTLVFLLIILAIGNLILTAIIVSVLRLGKSMESIEFISEENAIKLFGNSDLGHLYKKDGKMEGYKNCPVNVESQDSSIILNLQPANGRPLTKLRINRNGTVFNGFDSFDIKNRNGDNIFSSSFPDFRSLKGTKHFKSSFILTNRVVSPIRKDLKIEAKNISIKGAEGTNLDGKEILWSADQDIYVKSVNGSIVLSGKEGVFIDIKKIPIAVLKKNNYASAQFKLCVCMPEGKLFRIPVPNNLSTKVYCHHINMSPQYNPCI